DYGFAGLFWKAIPQEQWPTNKDDLAAIEEHWLEPFGDRRQELVFIGQGLDKVAMTKALDECLLNEEAVFAGETFWQTLPDPFVGWE
ncbi:GTP-binding protein, partial [Bacillus cereus group sp. Bce006]